jgi:hypothetical protein
MRLLARITVDERAVPWSPPRTIAVRRRDGTKAHIHKKDHNLIAWQDAVRAASVAATAGRAPYLGPVLLRTTFLKATEDIQLWGERWWHHAPCAGHGDLVNLTKACEDGLKSYSRYRGTGKHRVLLYTIPGVFADDAQVCDHSQRKRYGPRDGADIRVYALEG